MTAMLAQELDATKYPPAPWVLRGQAHFHVLAVRSHALPPVPAGFIPLRVGGFGLVVAGWLDYQGGSILRYGELLAAVAGRWAGGISATVTHMWVDSPASRAGGRELWGYPKELARFELAIDPSGTARARDPDGAELAHRTFAALVTSPWRLSLRGGTVQPLDGRLAAVRALMRMRPSLGRGSISAPLDSPLAFLNGAHTLLSLGMRDFEFTFGV
jgi:Acetoacetate decarboxylase (ADC)